MKIERGQWNPSLFKGRKNELWSYEDEGSCNEEEDYIPILKGPEYFEDFEETSGSERNYITPEI